MNMLKVFAFVLALAIGVAFTAQAWAIEPVAATTNGTVVKSMLHKVQEEKKETSKKKGKKGKKKKKGEGKEEPPK